MATLRVTSKAILFAIVLFTASCSTASVTETGSTSEPQGSKAASTNSLSKPSQTATTSSVEPSPTATTLAQNPATRGSARTTDPTTTTGSSSSNRIFFPTQKGPRNAIMTARGTGELIVTDGGCLRLSFPVKRGGDLLIWPPNYSLDTKGNRIRVLNANGRVMAEVGDYIEVGGGGLSSLEVDVIPESLRQELPERCPPPYFLVGVEVNVLQN